MITLFDLSILVFLIYCNIFLIIPSTSEQFEEEPSSADDKIPVNIQLRTVEYFKGKVYLSTRTNVTAIAEILDDKYKNLTLTYQWSEKNRNISAPQNASQIVYQYDKVDEDNFLQVLVSNSNISSGMQRKVIVVRDPINVVVPPLKLSLQVGDMLDVVLKFNGTGPFKYCVNICPLKEGVECTCKRESETEQTELKVYNYHPVRRVGNYTLAFSIDNNASRLDKQYRVEVTDVFRKPSIPYIPIIFSISAALVILTGLVLHLKLRRIVQTETADFDFIRQVYEEEEWDDDDEVQTFSQRVWFVLFKSRRRDQANNTHNYSIQSSMSASRTRLI